MARALSCFATLALSALLGLCLFGLAAPANAAPPLAPGFGADRASPIEQVRIYKRGRPPIYPYYYTPGRPGGWGAYIGFVPYAKGDYGTQALQRSQYPQDIEWPESMRAYGPVPSGRATKRYRR
jgi:hypothetical protein